jgi:heme/copper-type cytochrome/quinol oxidase subunit 3
MTSHSEAEFRSDIQARLADINRRAAEAQAKRDREFFTIIGLHLLVVVGAVFFLYSIPRAAEVSHRNALEQQENVNVYRR